MSVFDYRFFYASSACIYPEYKQLDVDCVSLKEADAWPAEVHPPVDIPLIVWHSVDARKLKRRSEMTTK